MSKKEGHQAWAQLSQWLVSAVSLEATQGLTRTPSNPGSGGLLSHPPQQSGWLPPSWGMPVLYTLHAFGFNAVASITCFQIGRVRWAAVPGQALLPGADAWQKAPGPCPFPGSSLFSSFFSFSKIEY